MAKNTIFLWYDKDAEAAARFRTPARRGGNDGDEDGLHGEAQTTPPPTGSRWNWAHAPRNLRDPGRFDILGTDSSRWRPTRAAEVGSDPREPDASWV